jgi:signal transduction histidine kinase
MISHDIRSPLAALTTVGELLESTELSERQASYLRILKSSTRNLLHMVNDVLDLGKLEAARMRLESKPINLSQLIGGLVDELRVEADRKGLQFVVEVDPDLPSQLLADAIKLGRILSNLIGNAMKFTDQGTVSVSVTVLCSDETSARIAFEVRDTGIGIPEAQLAHIFNDFTQGSDEIAARYGGSGLGLGICNKFLALYGSELEVDSTHGEGSRFRFELELEKGWADPNLFCEAK